MSNTEQPENTYPNTVPDDDGETPTDQPNDSGDAESSDPTLDSSHESEVPKTVFTAVSPPISPETEDEANEYIASLESDFADQVPANGDTEAEGDIPHETGEGATRSDSERVDEHFQEKSQQKSAEFVTPVTLQPVELERLRDQIDLFVPPPDYNATCTKLDDAIRAELDDNKPAPRILLITGHKKSGKQMVAINFANWLMNHHLKNSIARTIWFYSERHNDRSLLDIIYKDGLPENTVIVVREAIQKGLLNDGDLQRFSDYATVLKRHNAFLILTASDPISQQRWSLVGNDNVLTSSTDGINLSAVYEKYVQVFFSAERASNANKTLQNTELAKKLTSHFSTPSRLWRCFQLLRSKPELLSAEKELGDGLIELDTQAARSWFDGLTPLNPRLYAMFVALFETLDPQSIDDFFVEAVRFLRDEEGLVAPDEFVDPRQMGIYKLRSEAAVRESGPYLEFEDETYRQVVMEEVRNYYWLLWSLRGHFLDTIKELQYLRSERYPDYDTRRRARDVLAMALAQSGIYHRANLKSLLAELASHDTAFVSVAAATILQVLAETAQYDDFIVEVLTEWSHSKDADRIWVTCISVARLYVAATNRNIPSASSEWIQKQRDNLLDSLDRILSTIAEHYRDLEYDEEYLLAQITPIKEYFEQQGKEVDRNTIDDLIKRQKQFSQNVIRLALVSAIGDICGLDTERMRALLDLWLEPGRALPLYEHARMSLNLIWQQSSETDAVRLESRAFPLVAFLPVTLKASQGITASGLVHIFTLLAQQNRMQDVEFERHIQVGQLLESEPINSAVSALYRWYVIATTPQRNRSDEEIGEAELQKIRHEGDSLWEGNIRPSMMGLMNSVTASERNSLRVAILSNWLHTERHETAVHRTMQAVLKRAHLLNGEIASLPNTTHKGIIVVTGDASLPDDTYFEPILQFIRNIAGLIPLSVHRLGDTRERYIIGSHAASTTQYKTLTLRDLHSTGQRRPPLLMPTIQNPQYDYVPRECIFMVVFNSDSLLDVEDLFPTSNIDNVAPTQTTQRISPLRKQQLQEASLTRQPLAWEWSSRVFLARLEGVPDDYRSQIIEIDRELFGLPQHLLTLIAQAQQTISLEEQCGNLRLYTQNLPLKDTFSETMNQWLVEANNNVLYDSGAIDIMQAIASAFLIEVQDKGVDEVCDLLTSWLNNSNKKDLTKTVGVAITRMLFAFFTNIPTYEKEQLVHLSSLLPHFTAAIASYSELVPIIEHIVAWTNSQEQLNSFVHNDNLEASLNSLDPVELHHFVDWLKRYDYLPVFIETFSHVHKSTHRFRALMTETREWFQKSRGHRGVLPQIASLLPRNVFLNLLHSFHRGLAQDEETETYYWLLATVVGLKHRLLTTATLQNDLQFRYRLVEHLRNIARKRLGGSLPQLEDGHYYGIVFVDTSTKATRRLTNQIVPTLVHQRPDNLTLMLHHLGSGTIIQQVEQRDVKANPQAYETTQARLPIIGPVLSRYDEWQTQVAFVLVITPQVIIDYDDWVEMEDSVWTYRTWLVSTNQNWMPTRGELVNIRDSAAILSLVKRLYEYR